LGMALSVTVGAGTQGSVRVNENPGS